MAILDYQAIKFEGTSSENRLDALTVEEALQVECEWKTINDYDAFAR